MRAYRVTGLEQVVHRLLVDLHVGHVHLELVQRAGGCLGDEVLLALENGPHALRDQAGMLGRALDGVGLPGPRHAVAEDGGVLKLSCARVGGYQASENLLQQWEDVLLKDGLL